MRVEKLAPFGKSLIFVRESAFFAADVLLRKSCLRACIYVCRFIGILAGSKRRDGRMKIRLNKKVLSEMPASVRSVVSAWQSQSRRAFISVESCASFCADENSRVTMINLGSDRAVTCRVAGDFAGLTRLSPTAMIPLEANVVGIEQGFFCGVPYLTIYQAAPLALVGGAS